MAKKRKPLSASDHLRTAAWHSQKGDLPAALTSFQAARFMLVRHLNTPFPALGCNALQAHMNATGVVGAAAIFAAAQQLCLMNAMPP